MKHFTGQQLCNMRDDRTIKHLPNGYIANWSGLHTNLASLRAVSSMDMNSISEDPLFLNYSEYNMSNPLIADKGTPLSEVVIDIEGDIRNINTPDIGCDEYTVPLIDAGIFSIVSPTVQDTQYYSSSLVVELRNFALTPKAFSWST